MTPSPFSVPIQPDIEQAFTFCRLLFQPGDIIHFRAIPDKKGSGQRPVSVHYVFDDGFRETLHKFLLYCDVEQRAAFVLPGPVNGTGTKAADVLSLSAVLMDFDKGDPSASLAAAEELIGPASIVLESGGVTAEGKQKLHAHWLLTEKATGADITTACKVREELAKQFGGDPAFKQPAQIVRISGSVHHKAEPKLVQLRAVRPEAKISLADAQKKLGTAPQENLAAQPSNVIRPMVWDLNAVTYDTDVDRVLTQDTHEGGVDDLTRFEAVGKAIGYHLHLVRIGTLPDLPAAWNGVKLYNEMHIVPPWPEDRLRHDFDRLVKADLKEKGAFVVPAIATAPAVWAVTERRADRFKGEPPKRLWLGEGMIPLGTVGTFCAPGDAGKSMLEVRLGLYVSCYGPSAGPHDISDPLFFGAPVRARGAVVVLTGEDDEAELHRRISALDPTNIREGRPFYVVSMISEGGARAILMDGPNGPQPTPFWDDLKAQLEAIPDLKLIVFDPLSTFTGADLNDNAVGAALMTMLAALASKTGAAVMVVHHLTKNSKITGLADARDAIRGAGALVDNSRWALVMWEANEDDRFKALDALGRKGEAMQAGLVYKGGLAKSNAPGKKLLRTLVRDLKTGILEDQTDIIRSNTPKDSEIDDAVFAALLDFWQVEKRGAWNFTGFGASTINAQVYPAMVQRGLKSRYGLTNEKLVESLRRLNEIGKIRKQKLGKGFEPVAPDGWEPPRPEPPNNVTQFPKR